MTDTASEPAPKPTRQIPKGAGNIWTDIGPVLAFVIVYNVVRRFPENNGALSKENAIFWGDRRLHGRRRRARSAGR